MVPMVAESCRGEMGDTPHQRSPLPKAAPLLGRHRTPLFWHHKTRAVISLLITSSYLSLASPSLIFCSLSCLVSSLITPWMRSLLSHSVPLGRRWVCGCVRGNEQASCFLLSPSRSILSLPMPPPEVWYNCLWKHCLPVISYCSGRVSTKCKTATI